MIQYTIIGILFAGALFYIAYLLRRSFTSHECKTGCNCGADFKKIEEKIQKDLQHKKGL